MKELGFLQTGNRKTCWSQTRPPGYSPFRLQKPSPDSHSYYTEHYTTVELLLFTPLTKMASKIFVTFSEEK